MKSYKSNIDNLINELNKYSYEYYVLDNPIISDKEYDKKYDKLVELEKKYNYYNSNSPTQRIGDITLKGFNEITHKSTLYSLDKSKNKDAVQKYVDKSNKFVEEYNKTHKDKLPKPQFVMTKKFDGLTINVEYNNGILYKSGTRGNGLIGEEITEQSKTIINLPHNINYKDIIDFHGECLMTKNAFNEYNKTAKIPLKNLRNGAAGALRNLNIKEASKRKLITIFYDISYINKTFINYTDKLDFMNNLNLSIAEYTICNNINEIYNEIDHIHDIRNSLQYDIDGIVITINDLKTQKLMGYNIKFPKYATAYKFEAKETTTKLLDVSWQVSKSGRITPVAILEPVELMGSTVKRATLNNIDDIKRKDLKINSDVFIRKSNDVIPFISGISSHNKDSKPIDIPKYCPDCGKELIRDGVYLCCDNTLNCKSQLIKCISHYTSKEALNIVGLSEKTIKLFMENNIIKSIIDIYNLSKYKNQMINLKGFGEKKYDNLIDNINKSKNTDISSFLYGLSIPNIGKKTINDLIEYFNLNNNEDILNKFFNISEYELMKINDIGEVTANEIYKFFHNDKNIKIINNLKQFLIFKPIKKQIINKGYFADKKIVITGELIYFSRSNIKQYIKEIGGIIQGSVNSKTDYVIVGNKPGSKYNKAKELNKTILSEFEFMKYSIIENADDKNFILQIDKLSNLAKLKQTSFRLISFDIFNRRIEMFSNDNEMFSNDNLLKLVINFDNSNNKIEIIKLLNQQTQTQKELIVLNSVKEKYDYILKVISNNL